MRQTTGFEHLACAIAFDNVCPTFTWLLLTFLLLRAIVGHNCEDDVALMR